MHGQQNIKILLGNFRLPSQCR